MYPCIVLRTESTYRHDSTEQHSYWQHEDPASMQTQASAIVVQQVSLPAMFCWCISAHDHVAASYGTENGAVSPGYCIVLCYRRPLKVWALPGVTSA